ncbi:hypothetical protein D5O23_07420 [Salmonella enterica subsp. enterica]|nr:hypothetical protein [Salmonella enterica subsp. enterica serovar Mokola]EBU9959447.1 hypothetical protein [Salmonella enterica subsp. enterica serovar Onireke]EDK8480224.1 hypothetical protein [Salmonella enterica subsp. enterica serovar Chailey]HDA4096823.1 immunoglobulin domain-containing protein [Salmonella enterica subsp. enterica serovar Mokola]HDA4105397.1 immunoglobulin domain-containing protein [Salmonella enterica subsp. enterica serovar Mokola]
MANCQNSNERVFGSATVLELAYGCPDVRPDEDDWLALGAGTSKGLAFSPNSVSSDADDTGGWVENIITNADGTVSFEGEVRKHDKLDQFGYGNLVKYFADEVGAKLQPSLWARLTIGPIEFSGYMVITDLTPADGGSNDIITFSVEFKVSDGTTVKVENLDAPALAFTTDLTATKSVTTGSALTMSVVVTGGVSPYTYVWKKDGTTVSGQTTATFSKSSAASGDAGVYTCEVTDSATTPATITSTACTVTVS